MAEEPWGEPLWMARQLYRTARTTNDSALMKDAVKEVRGDHRQAHRERGARGAGSRSAWPRQAIGGEPSDDTRSPKPNRQFADEDGFYQEVPRNSQLTQI